MKKIFCTLCLGMLFAVAQAGQIPVEDFAKPIEYRDAILSPDGKYIAVERAADMGKSLIAVVQTKDLKLLSHIPATYSASPINPRWISNERIVVEMTTGSKRYENEFLSGELDAMDADGGNKRNIVEYQDFVTAGANKRLNTLHGYARVVHTLPGDEEKVMISFWEHGYARSGFRFKLYKLHSITGKIDLVAEAPSYDAYFTLSATGDPLFSFGRDKSVDDKNIWVSHRYREGKWEKLPVSTLEAEKLVVIAETDNPSEMIILAIFTNKTSRLYRYNLETDKKEVVFAHPKVDPADYDIDPATNRLIAVHFEDGMPNVHLVDQQHLYSRWYPALFEVFSGKRVKITSATDDGSLLVVHVSGANEPGQFHLFDTKTKKLKYLFNAASWIKPETLSKTETFTMKARDGLELSGYLTLPREAKGPAPLVVLPHGGPQVRDWWAYDPEVQFLASRGYAVLQVNFRGSGGFGFGFESAGYGKWGSDIQHDIIDATRWAAQNKSIDGKRICIMGASFGGYSALMSPILEPDLYKCAIGNVGSYDLNLMWSTANIQRYQSGENYLELAIGSDKAVLDKFSPAKRAVELKAPVFLAHGEVDWQVDVKHFYAMEKALKARNHPHETMLIEKGGHGGWSEQNQAEYLRRVEAFLGKYIGAGASTQIGQK
jgi:dipeptidyl aminopeptidase/acylaminoacyl peptidase